MHLLLIKFLEEKEIRKIEEMASSQHTPDFQLLSSGRCFDHIRLKWFK